ncbi:riboflavin synthase [Alicyclobacillus shizuokensis]|uniref:riboflavin synthase n=1 Tax=Alicyclobacillus shizuokensis TaxID=392014 RepID=UPI00082E3ABA|nr:riboflavin synthase [Alicyclobacillus shizuokensis]MCL6626028.1 riboflavin synthase [Alicyclobacillus shizuokensis]
MFTGLVEEVARVVDMEPRAESVRIRLAAERVLEDVRLGDSIAVNGVCLTVVAFDSRTFTADAVKETLRRSNLGRLRPGSRVNVERALRVGDRLGGHIVAGHVDAVGILAARAREGVATVLTISAPLSVLRYVVEKGSICVDGVSLTVMDVDDKGFRVSIIPHTGAHTTLLDAKVGQEVNLEVDVLAKYLEKLAAPRLGTPLAVGAETDGLSGDAALDLGFLRQHGYA